MKRLLVAEFRKLSNHNIVIFVLILIFVFCTILIGMNATAFDPSSAQSLPYLNQMFGKDLRSIQSFLYWYDGYEVRSIFFGELVPLWCGAILAAVLIGQDFDNRVISLSFMAGHSRVIVFLEKVLVYFFSGLLLSLSSLFLSLSFYRPDWVQLPFLDILRYLSLRALTDIATLCIPFFFSFLCRDLVKTISVSGAYAMLMTYLLLGSEGSSVLHRILSYHPAMLFQKLMLNRFPFYNDLYLLFISAGALLLVTIGASYLILRRMELK